MVGTANSEVHISKRASALLVIRHSTYVDAALSENLYRGET